MVELVIFLILFEIVDFEFADVEIIDYLFERWEVE
jgi:hypothetical protein